jgi:hypothetical protein
MEATYTRQGELLALCLYGTELLGNCCMIAA